ncbi:MAG: Crp/Fnr family transcriptional regulator [Eubacterium sp.]|nr:Crp/Fnr family transcriptional regulator [Eubacterium sp.]
MSKDYVLSTLPEKDKAMFLKKSSRISLKKGEYLFNQGDAIENVYLIHHGHILLVKEDGADDKKIVGFLSDGECIWEGALLGDKEFEYSTVCLTDIEVFTMPVADFDKVISSKKMYRYLIALMSEKLHDVNRINEIIIRREPESRIAGLLCYYDVRKSGEYIELTLDEIAEKINLRMETVSRKLKQMEKDGIIKRIGKGKLKIISYKKLNATFEFDVI